MNWCTIQHVILPQAQRSRDRLLIYHDPEQGNMSTEAE